MAEVAWTEPASGRVSPEEADRGARIGPNAAIQLDHALREIAGEDAAEAVFAEAGLSAWRRDPPVSMIPERHAVALFQRLYRRFDADEAGRIAARAGALTADYIIAHRIPAVARVVLRRAPPALARPMLARAIAGHAWTFAGSGRFRVAPGRPLTFELADNPLAIAAPEPDAPPPSCQWHAAVFQQLFRALADPRVRVVERACGAGRGVCRFDLTPERSGER